MAKKKVKAKIAKAEEGLPIVKSVEKDLRVVLYTDGSAAPTNPGKAGGGIHGFIYDPKDKNKPNRYGKYLATNKGYIDTFSSENLIKNSIKEDSELLDINKFIASRATFTKENNYITVNPIYFIEGYVSIEFGTNNAAELIAVLEAIKYCINCEKDISKLTIFTDSSYVVNACHQISQYLARGQKYIANKNRVIIDEIQYLHKKAKEKNLSISVQWVKGHADNAGNIKADILADIGREASLTDFVSINTYSYEEYFASAKIDSVITDNFSKIIDANSLKHTIEINEEVYDVFYGIYNKDVKSNGKTLLPSSYVSIVTNAPDRETLKIKKDLLKLYLSKARNSKADEYVNIVNLKELSASDVSVYTNKYGYQLSLDIDSGNKIKLLGDSNITLATANGSSNALIARVLLELNDMYNYHLVPTISDLDTRTKDKKANIIDITNSIYKNNELAIKESASFHYKDSKYLIPAIIFGTHIPEYKILKKISKKVDKVLLSIDNDKYSISIVLRNKDEITMITYLNPNSMFFYAKDEK